MLPLNGDGRDDLPERTGLHLGRLFLFGAASRVVVVVAGILCPQRFAVGNDVPWVHFDPLTMPGWRQSIEHWFRWDAVHYMNIALHGYSYSGDPTIQSNVAFMPLLPALIAGGAWLGLDPFAIGLLIPNLAFAIGLVFFGRVVAQTTGSEDTAWRACILLVSFPTAFFFSAPYHESLGFLLSSMALLAWINQRTGTSVIGMMLGATARQSTVAMSLAFPAEWLSLRIRGRPARPQAWLIPLGAFIGAASVSAYMYWKFGDPFVSSKALAGWERDPPGLLNLLKSLWPRSLRPSVLADYAVMLGVLLLSLRALRRRGAFWGAASAFPALLAMSFGEPLGMKRYVLSSFPVFMEGAELLKRPWLLWPVVVAGSVLQVVLIYNYVNWGFSRP